MFERVHAGAVAITYFQQDTMSPASAAADRKGRSPITPHEDTTRILKNTLALAHIGAKGFGRQSINSQMIGPVTRQLVPTRKDPPHQRGVPTGNPSQYEEGRLSTELGEGVENALGIALNALRQMVPVLAIDRRGESFNVKIVLDVDRHCVRDTRAHIRRSARIRGGSGRSSIHDGFDCAALKRFGCRAHGLSP